MKSAFSRNLTTVVVILMATLVLTGIIFRLMVKDYLTDYNEEQLERQALVIADLVSASCTEDGFDKGNFVVALSAATSAAGVDAVICDADGMLLLCADSPFGCEHVGMMLAQEYLDQAFSEDLTVSIGKISGLYDDVRYVISVPILDDDGSRLALLIVSQSVGNMAAVVGVIIQRFVIVSLSVVGVALILMVFSARRQSAPLQEMASTARAFGHGELSARVKTNGKNSREVEELALAFNNMATSLEKSEYQRQEFVANVSHELKTPMTTISGYVDGILDGTIPPDQQEQYLRIVSDETKRLSRLVRSMLDISRLQSQGGIPEEQMLRFDLEESAGRTLLTFEQKISDKHLDVQVDMPEHPVYVQANQDAITQVIYNLLDNAIKFSPDAGTLELTIREGGGKAYLSIANQGETIPSEELPLVFDRFHKIDKSRSQNRDSWGLGLYIVKTIVDSHGENISVTSRDDKTTFTFTLKQVN